MKKDRTNLLDELINNPTVEPPFFWHQMKPERQRWAIEEVWRNGSPLTRPFYDRGATTGEHGPNAVTRWLLYSVFRSRDDRNDRTKRKPRDGGKGPNSGSDTSGGKRLPINLLLGHADTCSQTPGRTTSKPSSTPSKTKEGRPYYDPARNGYK
jgi:hypothetical protein